VFIFLADQREVSGTIPSILRSHAEACLVKMIEDVCKISWIVSWGTELTAQSQFPKTNFPRKNSGWHFLLEKMFLSVGYTAVDSRPIDVPLDLFCKLSQVELHQQSVEGVTRVHIQFFPVGRRCPKGNPIHEVRLCERLVFAFHAIEVHFNNAG